MREQFRLFRGDAIDAIFRGERLNSTPWPFVEVILYYLSNTILEQGNCFADVPGSNGVNLCRVAIANEYL
jgi:hypothetical protein